MPTAFIVRPAFVLSAAQVFINAMEGTASDTREEIRKQLPADQEANEQLGTIYQRLV